LGRNGLSEFEQQVLLVVHHQQGQGYAVSIGKNIEERSGKSVILGSVYVALDRLEKKGFISSKLGEATPERGGKPKRLYRLEAPGVLALSEIRAATDRMWADAPPLGAPA
jgi:PadR family transcriptional regulator, regulatory protein PadR